METVISTEAAHGIIVSSAAEKSASPPQPSPSHRRAFCRCLFLLRTTRERGAPSIAHFAMGGIVSTPLTTTHCLCGCSRRCPFSSIPQNHHFDRSCSRHHREQRSGEICFSTPPSFANPR